MSIDNDPLLNLAEAVRGTRDIVSDQLNHLELILHGLSLHRDGKARLSGDDVVLQTILTMIHMVGISGKSLLRITEETNLQVRDAYPIARTIIEGSINVAFIMAGGRDTAERARRHAEVKAYRDLNRTFSPGDLHFTVKWNGELPDEEKARLEAMKAEFTTKKGHEKSWSDENIPQRLAAISEVFPNTAMVNLSGSVFGIYRHASEVAHGSYFSAIFFWGLTSPNAARPLTTDDLRSVLLNHQFSVLTSAIFAYAGLIECFAEYTNEPVIRAMAVGHINRLRALPTIAEHMARDEAQ